MAIRHATQKGTASFRARFLDEVHRSHFRLSNNLWFSSVGIGIYVVDSKANSGDRYRAALQDALANGCNHVDTTISHRSRISEQIAGQVLASAFAQGLVSRDEIVVASRGGQVVFEGDYPTDAAAYVRSGLIDAGVAAADEFAQGWHHCMSPRYLRKQFRQSLTNLGLGTLDIYYVHTPEVHRWERGPAVFESRLRAAFAELEAQIHAERLAYYGIATSDGFRVPHGHPSYLSLARVVELARDAGGANHHLRYIQAPLNLAMREVFEFANQRVNGTDATILEAARELGVTVIGNLTLWDGQLAWQLPQEVRNAFPEVETNAQAAIQFARSVPGLVSAVVGMGTRHHVRENMAVSRFATASPAQLATLFGRLD